MQLMHTEPYALDVGLLCIGHKSLEMHFVVTPGPLVQ